MKGFSFSISEMTSQAQIVVYSGLVNKLDTSLEDIIQYIFVVDVRGKDGKDCDFFPTGTQF